MISNHTGEDFQQAAASILHIFTFPWLFLSDMYSYVSLCVVLNVLQVALLCTTEGKTKLVISF